MPADFSACVNRYESWQYKNHGKTGVFRHNMERNIIHYD